MSLNGQLRFPIRKAARRLKEITTQPRTLRLKTERISLRSMQIYRRGGVDANLLSHWRTVHFNYNLYRTSSFPRPFNAQFCYNEYLREGHTSGDIIAGYRDRNCHYARAPHPRI